MKVSGRMNRFLSGMEYPARPEDLVREAQRGGFSDDDVLPLAALNERSYQGAVDVRRALANSETPLAVIS